MTKPSSSDPNTPQIAKVWQQEYDKAKKKELKKQRDATPFWVKLKPCLNYSWLIGIFVFLFLAIAFSSYCPSDAAYTISSKTPIQNTFGLVGAWTADIFFWFFGLSSWWCLLGCLGGVWFALRKYWRQTNGETIVERLETPWISSTLGFLALLIGSSSLEALRLRRFSLDLPGEPGGVVGDALAAASAHLLGVAGATIIFFLLIAVGLSLLLDFEWIKVFEACGKLVDRFIILTMCKGKLPEASAEKVGTKMPQETKRDEKPQGIPQGTKGETQEHQLKIHTSTNNPTPLRTPITNVANRSGENHSALTLDLLENPPPEAFEIDQEAIALMGRVIVGKLESYNIPSEIKGAQSGPVITQYWLEPGLGVKGSAIENVREDLRRALSVNSVRVVQTVPGTSYIGLEVPNPKRQTVYLKEILSSPEYEKSHSLLTLALGKDIAGNPFMIDLTKMPHLLVAGTTGSGKSVGINSMILSMLYRTTPEELRLVLIDPKMLEFSPYEGIGHLLCPVVTDMTKATVALKWLTNEMERRYSVMSSLGVRSFDGYNEKVLKAKTAGEPLLDPRPQPAGVEPEALEKWPYIVCIVDELADLILTNRKEVELHIIRLAQKARAAGIHLILATQRPSADVVTSLIKTNVPARLSFQVSSRFDSGVILGESGAEELLGNGDMLYKKPGMPMPVRVQGCFIRDEEVMRASEVLQSTDQSHYLEEVTEGQPESYDSSDDLGARSGEKDEFYDRAVALVISERRASTSRLQRSFGIGYNRAANLMEAMENAGVVSAPNAAGKREILVENHDY